MVRFPLSDWIIAAGLVAAVALPTQTASGAIGGEVLQTASAGPASARMLPGTADVELRFLPEGGAESGHVRVELTPETRPLTIFEARSAAQQAFLAALNEPGLGDKLSRIKVVVRLMPSSDPAAAAEEVFLFLSKGGNDWSVLSGE